MSPKSVCAMRLILFIYSFKYLRKTMTLAILAYTVSRNIPYVAKYSSTTVQAPAVAPVIVTSA